MSICMTKKILVLALAIGLCGEHTVLAMHRPVKQEQVEQQQKSWFKRHWKKLAVGAAALVGTAAIMGRYAASRRAALERKLDRFIHCSSCMETQASAAILPLACCVHQVGRNDWYCLSYGQLSSLFDREYVVALRFMAPRHSLEMRHDRSMLDPMWQDVAKYVGEERMQIVRADVESSFNCLRTDSGYFRYAGFRRFKV